MIILKSLQETKKKFIKRKFNLSRPNLYNNKLCL